MRCRVYRNLDRSIEILGLSPFQIIVVAIVLVLGGEIVDLFGFSRLLSLVAAILLFLFFLILRRRLGEHEVSRLWRFICLPDHLYTKVMTQETFHKKNEEGKIH